jgi:hypothetical protein
VKSAKKLMMPMSRTNLSAVVFAEEASIDFHPTSRIDED